MINFNKSILRIRNLANKIFIWGCDRIYCKTGLSWKTHLSHI